LTFAFYQLLYGIIEPRFFNITNKPILVSLTHYKIRSVGAILISLVLSLYAETRTITADVNGDNIYDAIKVTDDAVYVIDKMLCCTKKRFPVISSCDSIYDVLVNDYSCAYRSNEVAIVFGKQTASSMVIYAFNNGVFSQISDHLPGMITYQDNVPCVDGEYIVNGDTLTLPWPIIETQGHLKPAILSCIIDSSVTIAPADVFGDTLIIPSESYMLIAVWKHDSNVSISVRDNKGKLAKEEINDNPVLLNILDPTMHDYVLQVDNNHITEPGIFHYFKCIFTQSQ